MKLKLAAHVGPNQFQPVRIGKKWKEYQGGNNWDGLLDPLDEGLRREILRYGKFVQATYKAFNFEPSSPSYATCRYPKQSFFNQSGLSHSGYSLIRNLHATSGIKFPRWADGLPSWVSKQSSWIGYVAVCQDEEEIQRLGRRDVVIAFRGTATCLEWLENLRASLTQFPKDTPMCDCPPMVESGFLSLYTSHTAELRSLQDQITEEIGKLFQSYGHESISLTLTGHSLGAALATLAAYHITTTFEHSPMVTVISFGGPRVGNRSFSHQLEKRGSKVLRIVNTSDLITKVPGFVEEINIAGIGIGLPKWLHTQWVYANVGRELQLSTGSSPTLHGVAACHELDTYLQLVTECVSSSCPFKDAAMNKLKRTTSEKAYVR